MCASRQRQESDRCGSRGVQSISARVAALVKTRTVLTVDGIASLLILAVASVGELKETSRN